MRRERTRHVTLHDRLRSRTRRLAGSAAGTPKLAQALANDQGIDLPLQTTVEGATAFGHEEVRLQVIEALCEPLRAPFWCLCGACCFGKFFRSMHQLPL